MGARLLSSAVESHCIKINSLVTQNYKMMSALVASGIDATESDPSTYDYKKDCKVATNKRNPNHSKNSKKRKW